MALVAPLAALPSVEAKEVRVYSGRHYNTDRAAGYRWLNVLNEREKIQTPM